MAGVLANGGTNSTAAATLGESDMEQDLLTLIQVGSRTSITIRSWSSYLEDVRND
jgi:hypothetical protein